MGARLVVGRRERKNILATEEWRVPLGRRHRRQLWTPGGCMHSLNNSFEYWQGKMALEVRWRAQNTSSVHFDGYGQLKGTCAKAHRAHFGEGLPLLVEKMEVCRQLLRRSSAALVH